MFLGKPYVNRGIAGQTTSQLLIRFRPDVIALHPKVVLILAGTQRSRWKHWSDDSRDDYGELCLNG